MKTFLEEGYSPAGTKRKKRIILNIGRNDVVSDRRQILKWVKMFSRSDSTVDDLRFRLSKAARTFENVEVVNSFSCSHHENTQRITHP